MDTKQSLPEAGMETFCPANQEEWRLWLTDNHKLKQSVWVIYHKKGTGIPSLSWSEAVDEALCFGWIDSVKKTIDAGRFIQLFSKRKANSTWSKINKDKIEQLGKQGKMAPAGWESIEKAKQNGSWTLLDEAEMLTIPKDLEAAFKTRKGAKDYFLNQSKSAKKSMLQWLLLARQPQTRQKRIEEIAACAAQQKRPKQF